MLGILEWTAADWHTVLTEPPTPQKPPHKKAGDGIHRHANTWPHLRAAFTETWSGLPEPDEVCDLPRLLKTLTYGHPAPLCKRAFEMLEMLPPHRRLRHGRFAHDPVNTKTRILIPLGLKLVDYATELARRQTIAQTRVMQREYELPGSR